MHPLFRDKRVANGTFATGPSLLLAVASCDKCHTSALSFLLSAESLSNVSAMLTVCALTGLVCVFRAHIACLHRERLRRKQGHKRYTGFVVLSAWYNWQLISDLHVDDTGSNEDCSGI